MDRKYVKIWTGYISGSMAGRDDGHPKVCQAYYDSLEALLKDVGKHGKSEVYYELKEVNPTIIEDRKKQLAKEKEDSKKSQEAKDALKKKIDGLSAEELENLIENLINKL